MAVQNFIFNALQQALFALLFDDETPEEEKKKYANIGNGMLDSILRGMGYVGAATSTVKNTIIKLYRESKKPRPKYADATLELLSFSPPIDSKISKARRAFLNMQYSDEGFGKNMESAESVGLIISATTNIPIDRVIQKAQNIKAAVDQENEWWQRIALSLGWPEYSLEIGKPKKINAKEKKQQKERDNWYNDPNNVKLNRKDSDSKLKTYKKQNK